MLSLCYPTEDLILNRLHSKPRLNVDGSKPVVYFGKLRDRSEK